MHPLPPKGLVVVVVVVGVGGLNLLPGFQKGGGLTGPQFLEGAGGKGSMYLRVVFDNFAARFTFTFKYVFTF